MNTIYLYYTILGNKLSSYQWEKYMSLINFNCTDNYNYYNNWMDNQAHLFGRLLLQYGYQKLGFDDNILNHIKYEKYGRPYIIGGPDFNISHSSEHIVCAIGSQVRIGIDVENIESISIDDFKNSMNVYEWNYIKNSYIPEKIFIEYWSIKEAVAKCDGRGIYIPFKSIYINQDKAYFDGKEWFFKKIFFNNTYAYVVCTSFSFNVIVERCYF